MSDNQDKFINAVPLLESTREAHQGQKNPHQTQDFGGYFKGEFRESFPKYHPIIDIAPSQVKEIKQKKSNRILNKIITLLAAILSVFLSLEVKVRIKAHGALFSLAIIETVGRLSLIESLKKLIRLNTRHLVFMAA